MNLNEYLLNSLYGRNAHFDPIKTVEDISLDIASAKGINTPHTVWQMLKHMNYWQKRFLHLLKGETGDLNGDIWIKKSSPDSEDDLQKEIKFFKESILETEKILQENAPLEGKRGTFKSGYDVIQAMANHISYHTGQIVQMRKILGNWKQEEQQEEDEFISINTFKRVTE
jgi:uncharacterized damage-inducible protein DinB